MYSGTKGTFDDGYIRYILDTYSDAVIRLCYSYVRSYHDAEDIAEDVFCELVKSRMIFESDEHEKAWLLRVAVNKCKNHLKSARVRYTVSLEDDTTAEHAAPGSEDDMLPEDDSPVVKAVMALPEKYRTVIHLYYFEEMSIAQIAGVYKISKATVGTRLARGRALLKKRLGVDFDA